MTTFRRSRTWTPGTSSPLSFRVGLLFGSIALLSQAACSSDPADGVDGSGGADTGGSAAIGGSESAGGSSTGGASSSGRAASGGAMSTGGASDTGGAASGGQAAGGAESSGGSENTGGDGSGGDDGSGGGDGSGGAETGEFQPCPATGPCKILPFGDSITDGVGVSGGGGYRIELFSMALADGHDITFTGSLTNGPGMVDGVSFPQNHEGHSGWTVSQIHAQVPSPALSDMPHIILLHIGTNDMWNGAAGAPDRLGDLLDDLITEAPDTLIAVSNIIPWPDQAGAVSTYNTGIEPVIQARIDSGAHVIFVDQFSAYPSGQLPDGIHPNAAGYAVMAEVWYDAISSYLP